MKYHEGCCEKITFFEETIQMVTFFKLDCSGSLLKGTKQEKSTLILVAQLFRQKLENFEASKNNNEHSQQTVGKGSMNSSHQKKTFDF